MRCPPPHHLFVRGLQYSPLAPARLAFGSTAFRGCPKQPPLTENHATITDRAAIGAAVPFALQALQILRDIHQLIGRIRYVFSYENRRPAMNSGAMTSSCLKEQDDIRT
jgi:hypothetical protein